MELSPEHQAHLIQARADGHELSPERLEARETYRARIMAFIAGLATCSQVERPVDIGMDDEVVS